MKCEIAITLLGKTKVMTAIVKITSKIASKMSTTTLSKIETLAIVLKLKEVRSIISGELCSRNDLFGNF